MAVSLLPTSVFLESFLGVGGTGRQPLNPAAPSLKQILALLMGDQAVPPTPSIGGTCDSQATGGSKNDRNVKLAGHWGELKNKQIFDKESRHETRRPLAGAFSSKIWK